jgi:hypothetical protein
MTLPTFLGKHFFTDFFIYSLHHTFSNQMTQHIIPEPGTLFDFNSERLLFAEEGAVYHLNGEPQGGYILKMKHFDTDQSVWIPEDWVMFPFPAEINEKIYYYLFVECLLERNFEAAYYYATHVSTWLTRKIFQLWFEPEIDLAFEEYPDLSQMYAQIRATITFASLLFDVYSDDANGQIYPLKLEFVSRFKRRTKPIALARPPPPYGFVDNHISFDLYEMEDPLEIALGHPVGPLEMATINIIQEFIDEADTDSDFASLMTEPATFQNVHYLEFRKGPTNGDYCLVNGESIAAGIVQVTERIHPCVFIQLYDCNQDPWVNVENYRMVQASKSWAKFQEFLRFCLDPKLKLFFNVAPTNTFVALQ